MTISFLDVHCGRRGFFCLLEYMKIVCYNSTNATTSNTSINPNWKEVIGMVTVLTSLVVGVVSGVIAAYIYDKFIK